MFQVGISRTIANLLVHLPEKSISASNNQSSRNWKPFKSQWLLLLCKLSGIKPHNTTSQISTVGRTAVAIYSAVSYFHNACAHWEFLWVLCFIFEIRLRNRILWAGVNTLLRFYDNNQPCSHWRDRDFQNSKCLWSNETDHLLGVLGLEEGSAYFWLFVKCHYQCRHQELDSMCMLSDPGTQV